MGCGEAGQQVVSSGQQLGEWLGGGIVEAGQEVGSSGQRLAVVVG